MNSLFAISARAAKIESEDLSKADMLDLADMYSETRGLLATMFSYMAPESQARYTGFANALKDYEKKVTHGRADSIAMRHTHNVHLACMKPTVADHLTSDLTSIATPLAVGGLRGRRKRWLPGGQPVCHQEAGAQDRRRNRPEQSPKGPPKSKRGAKASIRPSYWAGARVIRCNGGGPVI